jgi:CRP-like cAMP-binding protein
VPLRKNAKIELLRRTPLFYRCSKAELAEIAALADEIDIPAGKVFIREGERGREFFALIEGKVDVRKRGRKLKIKGGEEFFGEIALSRRRHGTPPSSPKPLSAPSWSANRL